MSCYCPHLGFQTGCSASCLLECLHLAISHQAVRAQTTWKGHLEAPWQGVPDEPPGELWRADHTPASLCGSLLDGQLNRPLDNSGPGCSWLQLDEIYKARRPHGWGQTTNRVPWDNNEDLLWRSVFFGHLSLRNAELNKENNLCCSF